jgi:hypothetical protein
MKSHITVLINSTTRNIEAQLKAILGHHRLDDSLESIRAHHWDYWYFPEDDYFDDAELKAKFSLEPKDVLDNSSYVRNLPQGYETAGVICLDGTWVDLQDFGWGMLREPSKANDKAMNEWKAKLKEILSENRNDICVQIITHC